MRQPSMFTIVLGVLCVGLLGVATNIATGAVPEVVRSHAWVAWVLVGIALLAIAAIEVRRNAAGHDRSSGGSTARATLLDRCETDWIRGVLDRSLYREARIELGLDTTRDPDRHPWDMVAAPTQGPPKQVSATTPMREVFAELGGAMLLLGAPGAGKTTMLLELLRDLLAEARADKDAPIPVVVNLSSWAIRRRPLAEWLAGEIADRYQMASRHVAAWIQDEKIIPLLDGLDEVAEEHRQACVSAINEFHREYSVRLAVCSRISDYQRMDSHLQLYGTVTIRPLKRDQIEDFLRRAGSAIDGLRGALAEDPRLWEEIESPLMLSVAALAYADSGTVRETDAGSQGGRERLWSTYVREMLRRRRDPRYPPAPTIRSLAALAGRLRADNLSVFYLDLLTHEWLPRGRSHSTTFWLLRVPGNGVAAALILVPLGTALFGWPGLVFALVNAVVFAAAVALMSEGQPLILLVSELQQPRNAEKSIAGWLRVWGMSVHKFFEPLDIFFLVGLIIFSLFPAMTVGVAFGLTAGVFLGLTAGVGQIVIFFIFVLAGGLFIDAALGLTLGERRRGGREVPSPGLRSEMLGGVAASLIGGALAGVLAGLIVGWAGTAEESRRFGVIAGVTVALSLSLFVLTSLAEQLLLRRLLARSGALPWPCLPMFDHATRLLLLRKVGQDYLFIHRELLDFLADLPPERLALLLPDPSGGFGAPLVSPRE